MPKPELRSPLKWVRGTRTVWFRRSTSKGFVNRIFCTETFYYNTSSLEQEEKVKKKNFYNDRFWIRFRNIVEAWNTCTKTTSIVVFSVYIACLDMFQSSPRAGQSCTNLHTWMTSHQGACYSTTSLTQQNPLSGALPPQPLSLSVPLTWTLPARTINFMIKMSVCACFICECC